MLLTVAPTGGRQVEAVGFHYELGGRLTMDQGCDKIHTRYYMIYY